MYGGFEFVEFRTDGLGIHGRPHGRQAPVGR
jgi:hypothetical protein